VWVHAVQLQQDLRATVVDKDFGACNISQRNRPPRMSVCRRRAVASSPFPLIPVTSSRPRPPPSSSSKPLDRRSLRSSRAFSQQHNNIIMTIKIFMRLSTDVFFFFSISVCSSRRIILLYYPQNDSHNTILTVLITIIIIFYRGYSRYTVSTKISS